MTEVAAKPPGYLVLASASPQRSAILAQLGIPFEVTPADIEERADGNPQAAVLGNALRKARAVAGERVLGADTTVVLDGQALGKPVGEEQAEAFLRSLSGRAHEVLTAVALLEEGAERCDVAATRVTFRDLSEAEIAWYLESGEWRERAGGYAIQGRGAALVAGIEGDYSNVVGLPVTLLVSLCRDFVTSATRLPPPGATPGGR